MVVEQTQVRITKKTWRQLKQAKTLLEVSTHERWTYNRVISEAIEFFTSIPSGEHDRLMRSYGNKR